MTEPSFERARIEVIRGSLEQALGIAAALEQASSHPLGLALRRAGASAPPKTATALRHVQAAGVEGDIDGIRYRFGRAGFSLQASAADTADDDALVLADADGVLARFPPSEQLRPAAASLIRSFGEAGITCEILSGDRAARVARIAGLLGIDEFSAAASAADKLARLAVLRAQGHVVAMVGDGINDAPVLAAADVAIAIGEGSAMAHAASGILLASSRLHSLLEARHVAAEMLVRLKQNLNWALAYNLSAVPLAALGFVPPWLAAIGMSASSIVVILNSLRIGRRATAWPDAPRSVSEAVA